MNERAACSSVKLDWVMMCGCFPKTPRPRSRDHSLLSSTGNRYNESKSTCIYVYMRECDQEDDSEISQHVHNDDYKIYKHIYACLTR